MYHGKYRVIKGSFLLLLAVTCVPPMAHADPADEVIDHSPIAGAGEMKFVPNVAPINCSGTLELLKIAQIPGKKIFVRQVVRWSQEDSISFSAIADLVIDRYETDGNRRLTLDEIRTTLTGAGVNLGLVHFSGPRSCLLSHVDGPEPTPVPNDRAMVQKWIEHKNGAPKRDSGHAVTVGDSDTVEAGTVSFHTLRDKILTDLSQRLNIPVDDLQIAFDPKDHTVLSLTEGSNLFHFTPRRVADLGRVSWEVTITTGEKQRTFDLIADARAWQKQIIMEKSAAYKQIIRDEDVSERRILVDHLSEDPLLTRTQIVGQQAARDLKPGAILTGRLIDPLMLAKLGQTVSVDCNQGGIRIRTAGIAMESGTFGQTIKVQNEATKDVLLVTLTGPQSGTVGPAMAEATVASSKE